MDFSWHCSQRNVCDVPGQSWVLHVSKWPLLSPEHDLPKNAGLTMTGGEHALNT